MSLDKRRKGVKKSGLDRERGHEERVERGPGGSRGQNIKEGKKKGHDNRGEK